MSLRFFEPMIPPDTTHNDLVVRRSPSTGTHYVGKSDALKRAEAKWESHLARHAPERPMRGPLSVELRICWPTDGRHAQGEPKVTAPDNDNVEKVVWDVMRRVGMIEDDRFIAENRTMKMWGDPAGIYVSVTELGGDAG